jgi:predicted MFS family arabinose efflux permease
MQDSILTESKKKRFHLPLSGLAGFKVFLCFAFAYFLSYAFRAVNAVIAPDLIADLGIGNAALGLLSSAYFIGFALLQLPLGIWLDKYGSRKTESLLLIFAALGSFLFGLAENLMYLTAGRGFIGVGVSACLMASFTAYRQWFKPEQQGQLASGMLVFGTAGALMTTVPVQNLIPYIGWRGVFFSMSGLVVLSALAIRFGLPKAGDPTVIQKIDDHPGKKKSFLVGYGKIFKNGFFLQMLPVGIFNQGGFIAIQTLWLGPWFEHVVGLQESLVARSLFIFNFILLLGYLLNAWLTPRLNSSGISTFHFSGVMVGIALVFELFGIRAVGEGGIYYWYIFGLMSTGYILGQSLIQTHFPKSITGRASTAYNLMLFVGAFFVQWGIGLLLDLFISMGVDKPQALRYAMLMLFTLQLISYIWMWASPKILKPEIFVYKET